MSRTFSMPELAESVIEGEIVKWLAHEGDVVELDQPLLEVMTDKVTVEIPSPFGGVLVEHLAAEGDTVPVGTPIARFDAGPAGGRRRLQRMRSDAARTMARTTGPIALRTDRDGGEDRDDGDALTLFKAGGPSHDGPLPTVRKPVREPVREPGARACARPARTPDRPSEAPVAPDRPRGPWGRPLAVPAARKRARELGIELDQLLGSGPQGRIRVEDVEGHRLSGAAPDASAAGSSSGARRRSGATSQRRSGRRRRDRRRRAFRCAASGGRSRPSCSRDT
ncbi:MAG: biotin/lipoyl-containing protein [Trueperaceae bacterium]|nr:biotin/lipoyl-containing protein [Trueperaceae bacterium]